MKRDLTDTQQANVDAEQTRPVFIIRWEHSGAEELLSASGGAITYDGELFSNDAIQIKSIQNSRSAVLVCSATADRVAEVQDGDWRDGVCQIYYIPSVPDDDRVFDADEAILMIDGKITASKFSGGKITVSVIHKNIDGNYTPRNTAEEAATNIPAPGTVLLWDDDEMVLVGTR